MRNKSFSEFIFPNQQLMPNFLISQGKYYISQQLKRYSCSNSKNVKYNLRQRKSKQNKSIVAYCVQSYCNAKLVYQAESQSLQYKLNLKKSQFSHRHQLSANLNQKDKVQKSKFQFCLSMYASYFQQKLTQMLQKGNIQLINVQLIVNQCLKQTKKNQQNNFSKLLNQSIKSKEYSYMLIYKYIKENNWEIIQNKYANSLKRQNSSQTYKQVLTLENKILINKSIVLKSQTNYVTLYIKTVQNSINSIFKSYCLVYGFDQHSQIFVVSIAFVQSSNYHQFLYQLIQQMPCQIICFIIQQNPFLLGALKTIKNQKLTKNKQIQFLINPASTERLIQSCKCQPYLKEELKSLIYEKQVFNFDTKIKFLKQVFNEDLFSKAILNVVTQNETYMFFSKLKPVFIGNIFGEKYSFSQVDQLLLMLAQSKDLSELQSIILFLTCIKNNLKHFTIPQEFKTSQGNQYLKRTKNKELILKQNAVYEQSRYQISLIKSNIVSQIASILFNQLYQAFQFKIQKLQFQKVIKKGFIRVKTENQVFKVAFNQHKHQNQNCKQWHCQCQYYYKVGIPCGHQIRTCLTYFNSIFSQIHPFWKPKIYQNLQKIENDIKK